MATEETVRNVVEFIQRNLLPDDLVLEIDETTPLLEFGVLDSLKVAILVNYARDELGAFIPPELLTIRNFENPRSIAALIDELS